MNRLIAKAPIASAVSALLAALAWSQDLPKPIEGDYVANEFHFRSGEVLPQLRLHYQTLSNPIRDRNGQMTNAVVIMHATTGNGAWYAKDLTEHAIASADLDHRTSQRHWTRSVTIRATTMANTNSNRRL